MLDIFNLRLKNKINPFITNDKTNEIGQIRHFPPANKEWFNSIYAYNKNTPKLFFTTDKFIISLIRSYFNIYSKKLENKIKIRTLRTWKRRLTTNKILVSKAELKHTSDRVFITVYVYNRQKKYYINKIFKIRLLNILKKFGIKFIDKKSFLKRFRLTKFKAKKAISNVIKKENVIIKSLNLDNNKFSFKNYEIDYYKYFILRSLKKEMLYMYYKQILYLNKSKFENTFIINLKILLNKIYNKKVEINIVDLKYFHLNSDIFTQILALKIKNKKNRLYRVLRTSLLRINLPYDNRLDMLRGMYDKRERINSLRINSLTYDKNISSYNDIIDNVLHKLFKLNILDKFTINSLQAFFNLINNKFISGVRIEASGRLSKRMTAARSVFKKRYLGSLRDINSSYKGFSSVILRGHVKPNLQYTKVKSKKRIGSFGLKGWISSN